MTASLASRTLAALAATVLAFGLVGCRGEKLAGKTPVSNPTAVPTSAAPAAGAQNNGDRGTQDGEKAEQAGPQVLGSSTPAGSGGPTNAVINSPGGTGTTAAGTTPGTTTAVGPVMITTGANGVSITGDVDVDAVRKCLNLWGTHPFKTVSPANYKRRSANIAIGGIEINPVRETTATAGPQLVVIDVALNYASTTNWKLMNPQGWYCVKGAVASGSDTVHARTNIDLHCSAKLAKSNLALAVDSGTGNVAVGTGVDQGAQLGVFIDASVGLRRVDTGGAACM